MIQKKVITLLICCVIGVTLVARENELVEQVKIGNFAVDGTMQPVPFLGFGENIISQYEALGGVGPSWLVGPTQKFVDVSPYMLYGVRNDFSIMLGFPTAVSYKHDNDHSAGFSDLFVQLEYAFFETQTSVASNEFTVVGSVFLPTGNECKAPALGLGSPSFFLGVTASHLDPDWYYYISSGVYLRTKRDDHIKFGNRFVYEAGFGRNIAYSPEKWMLMCMFEFVGLYEQKTKAYGISDKNSGSNQIFFASSLWFSTQKWILQGGIAPLITQHFFGIQPKYSFFAGFSVCYRFT